VISHITSGEGSPSSDASIARLQDADHTRLADALPGQPEHERL
jgi:hypothetical protein